MRHYHQSNRTEEVSWDEWSGDKVKGPLRRKLEQVLLNFSTLIVGIMLVGGAFFVVYMIMKKILPMVSK